MVLRKKYALPKNAIIFAIHVQDRNKSVYASVDTRSLLTRINRDLQAGLEGLKELNEKTNQPVILIGSTFVAIGSRTKRILREKADFTELDSALLAFSSKLISFFNQDYFKRKAAVDREANLCWKTYIIHFHLPSLNN
ncbi:hypothetical protein HMPREF9413_5727 [Paenibacillus sp. HGF7]|nr:hypothetical protein HMPREF9413_5727 [Paenibacillus sp. HGF7]